MALFETLLKPEYFYRPTQVWRRITRPRICLPEVGEIKTPWGLPMTVRPHEVVGQALWHLGILDLAVAEALWRLVEPGGTVVDVGANIGFFSGLLAHRVGQHGTVHAFEPHPSIYGDLSRQVDRWRASNLPLGRICLHGVAASSSKGSSTLFEPVGFDNNHGMASLEVGGSESDTSKTKGRSWEIQTETLDEVLANVGKISVLKVDVEGHELSVFKGARRLLEEGRISHLVFEEHHSFPSQATQYLADAGYQLFQIGRKFDGPLLDEPDNSSHVPSWLPPNMLATKDPNPVLNLFAKRGWQCLG